MLNIENASVCLFPAVVMLRLCVRWLVLLSAAQLVSAQLEDFDDEDEDPEDFVEDNRNGRSKSKPLTSNVIPKSNGKYHMLFSTNAESFLIQAGGVR